MLFHCTAEFTVKLVPVTSRVNAGPPTAADVGNMLASVGMLDGCPITNVMEFEIAPFGFCTVTLARPAVVTYPAETLAVNCVVLFEFVIRMLPFHNTTAPMTNPDPFTVNVNPALPGAIAVGLIDEICGPLLAPITKVMAADTTLFVVTVTATLPAVVIRFDGTIVVSWFALT